uniref:Uncharacterized protein n=1 Tax=Pseudo-nitzschia delicatissima TaxID=44447 RepID=A0A7S0TBP2_9STRA|mmetsp:Transcript_574/g.1273  ORF Transcript_574/g.1273 Transcript_574/m.1273 type:complete len:545 (+) Transcript_574:284-1918(+)
MPIDLKWVRSDPDQVREWQALRKKHDDGKDNDVESTDLVDDVLRKDELSRKNLQNLQEHKRALKQLQVRLRPKKNAEENRKDDRENLMKEKKSVEAKIRLAEADWKASLEDTHKTLCRLASPVTKPNDYDLDASQVNVMPFSLPFGHAKSSLGMDLEQAWRQYTLCHFADYLWVKLPRGIPVLEKSPLEPPLDFAFVNLDRAQELWGPTKTSSNADRHPVVMLPSWIRLLTELLPSKSIWGEKELPRYTAIWSRNEINRQGCDNVVWLGGPQQTEQDASSSSLELVAIMAPSVVDAREIQNKLVQELLSYYSDLLSRKNVLKRIVVPAPDLHIHERSRIEIHVSCSTEWNKINTLRLGWVSHWGDGATRACDMAFAGGGVVQAGGKKKYGNRNASKEYVHLVEASVIDNSTWTKILYANSNAAVNLNSDGNENQWLVNVPPVLVPHLFRPLSASTSIPLKDLFLDEKSKRKKKESVFGVLGKKKSSQAKNLPKEKVATSGLENVSTRDEPKFPPLGVASFTSKEELQKRIRLEKLSCPYDFLFD